MKNTEELLKVISGDADTETRHSVLSNLDNDSDSKKEYHDLKNATAMMASEKQMPPYQLEQLYQHFQSRLSPGKAWFTFNSFLRYAAIFILAAGLSSLLFYKRNESRPAQNIRLSNTSVIAENGQRAKVILPDRSVVWLNAGTRLIYNNDFSHGNRDITLSGQAFFQVAENKALPFIVTCDNLHVKVLGTRFDINAYPNDEVIRVALQAGRVELLQSTKTKKDSSLYRLKPGQMAQFNRRSGKLVIHGADINRVTAWTDGILYFNDSPMKEVLIQLQRKYDIDIEVQNQKIYNSVFTATIKNETLEEIFKSIEYSCSVSCNIIWGTERDVKTRIIIR